MEELTKSPTFDPQVTLAYAQQNKSQFEQWDDLDDASFVKAMDNLRQNNRQLYATFWWWRKAEEAAGKLKEDDGVGREEARFRCFMIAQFLAEPFSADWEQDRQNLKPGITPWITDQQIESGLNHKTIKRWGWVWHDRDIFTEEDELVDRNGRAKAGERKFKHAHIVVDCPAKVTIATIAKWFNVPEVCIKVMRGRGAFLDGIEYLVHESPAAEAAKKTHYEDSEINVNPGFDFRRELKDLQAHRAKYGKRAGEMSEADTMRMHVMEEGWTLRECREDDPITYSRIRSSLPPLRLDYLMDTDPCSFRINIYVDGPGGIGKSSFCEYIAQAMFPTYDTPFFNIGNDERVTFDGYDGEPAIIWDDMRVVDFVRKFGANGAYRVLDMHPKKQAQQAKNSRVILTNMVNIINGVQPYNEFISGLAGTYMDKYGEQHEAEDENQAWRRFPLIIRVTEQDFDILINYGFVNNDLRAMKTMIQYANVRASLKGIMERLGGEAKKLALSQVGAPVLEAIEEVRARHDEKITDPNLVPDDLMPKRMEPGLLQIGPLRLHSNVFSMEYRKVEAFRSFVEWFWSAESSPWGRLLKESPYKMTRWLEEAKSFFDKLTHKQLYDALNAFANGQLVINNYEEREIRSALSSVLEPDVPDYTEDEWNQISAWYQEDNDQLNKG